MIRFAVAALFAVALPLHAARVRVVVAVDVPEISAASVSALRADVITSLETATSVEPWGSGAVFAAELEPYEVARLRNDPRVRAISIDDGGTGALLESAKIIGADTAYDLGFDGRGTTVAVLDTGIDTAHPDFAGRIVAQRCYCANADGTGCCPNGESTQVGEASARDDHGHGTHVSGIVAGGGANAPRGIASRANIVAVKVMDENNRFSSFTQIYRALEWIASSRHDVKVINASLGSNALFSGGACDSSAIALGLRDVIATLRARGVLIVASAGNQGSLTSTTLPACIQDVIGVGATYDSAGTHAAFCYAQSTYVDQVACFSNSSEAVDFVAPGADIVASKRGGGWIKYAGTSMAAPHVAGTIALIQQASGAALTAEAVEAILGRSATTVIDTRNSTAVRRIDAAAAIAITPRVPPQPTPRRRAVRH